MQIKLKVGQSEVNLEGWDILILALSGFGLLATSTATTLLQGLEKRARGAGSAAAHWVFDARRNPAGGPPDPSRWNVAVEGFDALRITTFSIYLIEMLVVWASYAFLPLIPIPYLGSGILFLFILMAMTPWVGFMFFGLEFILPGLAAIGELIPRRLRGTGDPVGSMQRGIINTLIPISILWIVLGIMAVFLSPPILPRPGIACTMRALTFGFFFLVGLIYIWTGRKFFKVFLILTVLGSTVSIVGANSWWRLANERELAVAKANSNKMKEEARDITTPQADLRKVYQPSPFLHEIAPMQFVQETLLGQKVAVGETIYKIPSGMQILVRTTQTDTPFDQITPSGQTTMEKLPIGTELWVINEIATTLAGMAVFQPSLEVAIRKNPKVHGYVCRADTDFTKINIIPPIVEVTMHSAPGVTGYMSKTDLDRRPDQYEDRPDGPRYHEKLWHWFGGPKPPDRVPTRQYSPPGTGTRAPVGSGATAMRGAASFPLTLQVMGGGSYTVMADGIAHPLSPNLNPPLLGGMIKFEDPASVDPSRITFGWILSGGDPRSFIPARHNGGPDLTLYGSGTAAQMRGWVVGAIIR